MASVSERVSAATGVVTYRVRFRINGQQREEGFTNDPGSAYEFKRLVEQVGGEQAVKVLRARQRVDVATPTLREYTERYLDAKSGMLSGIEPGTRKDYQKIARRSFLTVLGEYPLDAISRADVGRWVEWQEQQPSARFRGQNVSAKTIRNYHALLSSILASAVEEKLVSENVAYRTRLKEGVRAEATFLTPDEFATIVHFTPTYYKGIIQFLAGTGMRWGEATAITWGDISIHSNPPTARVTKAWKKGETGAPVLGPPKSRKGRRTISLYPELLSEIGTPGRSDALVFSGVRSNGHLWYHRFRQSTWLPTIRRAQDEEACREAGLVPLRQDPTIHDLRHSHASWLIAAGMPLPYIQVRLGHESITTTVGVYGHLVPDAHAQMADAIANTLSVRKPAATLLQIEAPADDVVEAELVGVL